MIETFWQIAASFQPNPQWGQRYDQTVQHDPNSEYGNPHYVQGNPLNVKTDRRGNFRTSDNPTYNPGHEEDGNWFDATEIKPSR